MDTTPIVKTIQNNGKKFVHFVRVYFCTHFSLNFSYYVKRMSFHLHAH